MAIAVASQSTTNWVAASTVTVTAPTGIAIGDLLFASITYHGNATITAPSGWSFIRQESDVTPGDGVATYYKVAVSADVSAVNYSWSQGATGSPGMAGIILRITGANTNSPITTSNGTGTFVTGNPPVTLSIPVTPNANTLLIASLCTTFNGGISAYAIPTSNPTWTTVIDNDNGTNHIGVAYGLRAANTATGNLSFAAATSFGSPFHTEGSLIAIEAKLSLIVSDTTATSDSLFSAVVVVLSEIVATTDLLITTAQTVFTNIAKSISTWINNIKN